MKKKNYHKAPLPFMGQKKRFLKQFKTVLKSYPDDTVFVDLFGGSGLLSHTAKQLYPNSKVVFNDFDNYSRRLAAISETNELLERLRDIVQVPRQKKLDKQTKNKVLALIARHEQQHGFVDYVSLSASILFGGKYAVDYEDLEKCTLYNCVRKSGFDATGYLEGVEVRRMDYRDLYECFESDPKAVFIFDPPYLQTQTTTYQGYWGLKDYLDILQLLEGNRFIYFTSNKSQIIELCEWFENSTMRGNPFKDTNVTSTRNTISYNSSYTDIMLSR